MYKRQILRNTLAVVGAVDIHLATAIAAIEQAREGSCFAPAVRVESDIPTDFLHKGKSLLVNDSLMGILENYPFVLRDMFGQLEQRAVCDLCGRQQRAGLPPGPQQCRR